MTYEHKDPILELYELLMSVTEAKDKDGNDVDLEEIHDAAKLILGEFY